MATTNSTLNLATNMELSPGSTATTKTINGSHADLNQVGMVLGSRNFTINRIYFLQ